ARYRGGWPELLVARHAAERGLQLSGVHGDVAREAVDELLKIRLIAAATQVVSRLIFDPFVVLLVLVVAQSPLFIAWSWYLPALLVAFLGAGTALACAVILQRSAKDGRAKAVAALDRLLLPLEGNDTDETRAKVLQLRTEIADTDSGIFAG